MRARIITSGVASLSGRTDPASIADGRRLERWPGKPPPAFFARKPLAHMIHEGSWYPATVLRVAMTTFADGPLSVPNLTIMRRCPHRAFCSLEEHALPTFAWQRYPRLVAKARPPVVAHVLDFGVAGDPCVRSPCTSACRESAHAFPALMNAVAGRPDLWCALKIARDSGNEATTEHLIAEVECGGLCSCRRRMRAHRGLRAPLAAPFVIVLVNVLLYLCTSTSALYRVEGNMENSEHYVIFFTYGMSMTISISPVVKHKVARRARAEAAEGRAGRAPRAPPCLHTLRGSREGWANNFTPFHRESAVHQ